MVDPLAAGSPRINATVMASAGTGKTWLLVTRMVRLLLAGARPDAILAITFTRKAAAEMQTRLGERLYALASAPAEERDELLTLMGVAPAPDIAEQARGLYEAVLRAPRPVRTTTFHAFCQDVLRRFPLEADVPPGFELLERTGELAGAAWNALMAEATAEPDGVVGRDLERLLDYCGGLDGLGSALKDFLGHRSDWWAYTEGREQPAQWAAAEVAARLRVTPGGPDPAEAFLEARKDDLSEFTALLRLHPTTTHTALADGLDAALASGPVKPRFEAAAAAFLTQKGEPRTRKDSKAQAGKMGEAGQVRFLELHAELCEEVLTVRDLLARIASAEATAAWYRLGDRLIRLYQRLKGEQRLLDFADLEWRAYRLLREADNAHWVQFKLDQRIDHLLVDEFQDTNPTQWRLLLPLLEEMAAGDSERRRSVFLVGDVKQSIYRFRRADPRLLPTAQEWLGEAMAARRHTLHVSRRSAPAVIDCVNAAFDEGGPLAGQLTGFVHHETFHRELWGGVELLPLNGPTSEDGVQSDAAEAGLRDPLTTPRLRASDDRYRREAEQLAERIGQLVNEQVPVQEEGAMRPIDFGDILVLVRSRTHVGAYEAALRAANIPYVGAERGTLLETLEVRDLVALLEVLLTPFNHLSVATVLRSPLFGCSDDDLMQLARGTGPWLERLRRSAEAAPGGPLKRAHRLMSGWRRCAGRVPMHDLLDRVYSEGNVLARYESAYPDHLRPRVRANLTRFLELGLEIDAGRYPSLTGFLARLSQLRDSAAEAPDEAPANSARRVRIMTIHAAKGLEAPAVFLADAAAPPPADSPFRALVDWPPGAEKPHQMLLLGRKVQRDSVTCSQLDRDREAEAREQANLLYVALTRARQWLFISGSQPRRGDSLGWYGAIAEALGAEDPTSEAPHRLCSGRPPPISLTTRPAEPPEEPPPAVLGEPLTPPPLPLEVAPSRSVDRVHGGDAGEEDALRRGIVLHRVLERLVQQGEQPGMAAAIAQEFGIAPDDPDYNDWWSEARRLLRQPALAGVFCPPAGIEAFCEVPIYYRRGDGCVVHGIVDRLLVAEDELWVIDYKTHRRAGEVDPARLAAPYREQLRLYAGGLRRLWPGRRVRASLLFTASAHLHDVDIEITAEAST